VVIFFVLLLDDEVRHYRYYYRSFVALFVLHFGITFTLRFLITSRTVRKVHDRRDRLQHGAGGRQRARGGHVTRRSKACPRARATASSAS
jgi:hypothetical protein